MEDKTSALMSKLSMGGVPEDVTCCDRTTQFLMTLDCVNIKPFQLVLTQIGCFKVNLFKNIHGWSVKNYDIIGYKLKCFAFKTNNTDFRKGQKLL